MLMGEECRSCLARSQVNKVRACRDRADADLFEERVKYEVREWKESVPSSIIMRRINSIHKEMFGVGIDYSKEKAELNAAILAAESDVYEKIENSSDPLYEAVCYAQAGNFIDYATMGDIDREKVLEAIGEARSKAGAPSDVYTSLKAELSEAKRLTVLHDNCGEIVFDKLLIKTIKKLYPNIEVCSVVRGAPIINDVTMEDALSVGLTEVCAVIGNGTDIPGTYLPEINAETKAVLDSADLIISKGLGNFETFEGNGYNAYYMFLTKCKYIADKTGIPYMSPGLLHEIGTK